MTSLPFNIIEISIDDAGRKVLITGSTGPGLYPAPDLSLKPARGIALTRWSAALTKPRQAA